jgi:hypothetical protein
MRRIVIALVTFTLFFIEGMFHYNVGRNGHTSQLEFHFPDKKDLLKIIAILTFFSVVNALVLHELLD